MPTLFTGAGANFARPMQSLARWAARDVTTGRLDCMKGRGIVSPPSDLENMRRCSAHFTNESLLDRHESIRAAASRGFRVLLLPLVLKELCCCCGVVVLWCCHVVVMSLYCRFGGGDEGWPLCATVGWRLASFHLKHKMNSHHSAPSPTPLAQRSRVDSFHVSSPCGCVQMSSRVFTIIPRRPTLSGGAR